MRGWLALGYPVMEFVSCGQPFGPTVHHLAAPFLFDNCGQWRCKSRIALIGDRFRGHAPWAALCNKYNKPNKYIYLDKNISNEIGLAWI